MKTLIVIPARYGSKRFPGKPLAELEGKRIIERVWEIASFVCQKIPNCEAVVATETSSAECPSEKIIDYCKTHRIKVITTSDSCRSGSDRVWEAAQRATEKPEIIVNLQGDVPTCPPVFVENLIKALRNNPQASVATIYTHLTWDALDELRKAKKSSPFSGTTVIVNSQNEALWFSKNIIPAIRNESQLRIESANNLSPVYRHVGLYAYRYDALQFFANSEKGNYEKLEQLEQLRFLENHKTILMVEGTYPPGYDRSTSGVDSPEDLERVAQIIRLNGELLDVYK